MYALPILRSLVFPTLPSKNEKLVNKYVYVTLQNKYLNNQADRIVSTGQGHKLQFHTV